MSAVARQDVVQQLADALAPHQVLIHHDFSQQPDFRIGGAHVRFVPEPHRTGWGTWGHTQGMFKTLREAVRTCEFDYFQMLSPSCLPARPLEQFEAFVASNQFDANNVRMDFLRDRQEFMHFAYRAYVPRDTLRYQVLQRIRDWYFGVNGPVEERANLQVRTSYVGIERGRMAAKARIALVVTEAARMGLLGRHPFHDGFRPMVGDIWFGVRPDAARYMLEKFDDPALSAYFARLAIPEELVIATILGNSGFRIGPANHFVTPYVGKNPVWLTSADLPSVWESGKFFARKFPNDPDAPVRTEMLAMLAEARAARADLQHPA